MLTAKTTHVRYMIVLMLFIASTFSYGDSVVLSIAASDISRDLQLDPLRLGYLLSGFGWAYALAQLPAVGLLDRFGSKRVYGVSIICWSICALLSGLVGYAPAAVAFSVTLPFWFVAGAGISREWAYCRSLVSDK